MNPLFIVSANKKDFQGVERASRISERTGKPHIWKSGSGWTTNYYGLVGPVSDPKWLAWFEIFIFIKTLDGELPRRQGVAFV